MSRYPFDVVGFHTGHDRLVRVRKDSFGAFVIPCISPSFNIPYKRNIMPPESRKQSRFLFAIPSNRACWKRSSVAINLPTRQMVSGDDAWVISNICHRSTTAARKSAERFLASENVFVNWSINSAVAWSNLNSSVSLCYHGARAFSLGFATLLGC